MIYFLVAIIVLLAGAFIYISIDFKRTKLNHEKTVAELNFVIIRLIDNQKSQLSQLKLSDDMKEKLTKAREVIDKDLLAMQYDYLDILSKNNLLE